ncbi:MAG: hypothetical protein AAF633_27910, partial [Chloroflexota bacterium]
MLGAAVPFLLFPSRFPLITAVLLILLAVNWLWLVTRSVNRVPASPFYILLTGFGLWAILPILVSTDGDLTLEKAAGLILGLAVWRWSYRYVQNQNGFTVLLWGSAALGVAVVGIGFLAVDWLEKVPAISTLL